MESDLYINPLKSYKYIFFLQNHECERAAADPRRLKLIQLQIYDLNLSLADLNLQIGLCMKRFSKLN